MHWAALEHVPRTSRLVSADLGPTPLCRPSHMLSLWFFAQKDPDKEETSMW